MMLEQIKSHLQKAQLEKDEIKISTLRLLLSEVHNIQIQKGSELEEGEILSVIQKELKKRKEAAESFKNGNRLELAEKEEAEARILESYLPAALSDRELTDIIEGAINEVGAKTTTDIGKVMSAVMGRVAGKADGSRVSVLVKDKLSVVSHQSSDTIDESDS